MIKKIGFILAVVALVIISGCAGPKQTTNIHQESTSNISVDIKGFSFVPAIITISNGTTVTWTNKDSTSHTVTGDNFDSGEISQSNTFSYTFKDIGTFNYSCAIHPTMKGQVIVK